MKQHNQYKQTLAAFSLLCTLGSYTAYAETADSVCTTASEIHYQSCDNQLGWYLGGELGFADSKVSKTDTDRFFEQANLNATSIAVDDKGAKWSAFVGYQFNSYFAIEAGYIDLGERSVDFTGKSTDLSAFYDNVEHIYPQSAKGTNINVVVSWPISEDFKLSGKLGYFDWQGKYRTNENTNQVGSDKISGKDLWYGLELNYRLTGKWQAYANYSQMKLTRDTNDIYSLGLRYYFSASDKAAVLAEKKAVAVQQVMPVDSDKDGIIDSADNCDNSDGRYQVDSLGCTLMARQEAEFNLVVQYANDSAEITADYLNKIAALSDFVNRYHVKRLKVIGHTSSPGGRIYNQRLSEQRSQSIAAMLVDNYSIKSEIIEIIGQGESQLLDSTDTNEAHQLNRRIEISLKESVLLPVTR